MTNQKWINEGGIFYPVNGNIVIHSTPGPGIWQVYQNPNPQDRRLGLNRVGDKFEFDYKLYKTGGEDIISRIKNLWNNEKYEETGKNLGVIFNGTKGTGKTVSAKILCNEIDIPTIIVNSSFEGLILDFIQNLEFECVVFVDEAEKTFTKDDDEILLKLIDGVYNKSRKLYLLTTNKLTVNENLLGRPGRIRYIQEFSNLPASVIDEYLEDNLTDKTKKSSILDTIDLLEISTIDILRALVEEVNILGDIDENSPLNIPKANYAFDILCLFGLDDTYIPKISKFIQKYKPKNMDLYSWFKSKSKINIDDDQEKCEDRKNVDTEDEDTELAYRMEYYFEGCSNSYVTKITSSCSTIWENTTISIGTVVKAPNEDGVFAVKTSYSDILCVVLKKRNNPSLYRGKLIY